MKLFRALPTAIVSASMVASAETFMGAAKRQLCIVQDNQAYVFSHLYEAATRDTAMTSETVRRRDVNVMASALVRSYACRHGYHYMLASMPNVSLWGGLPPPKLDSVCALSGCVLPMMLREQDEARLNAAFSGDTSAIANTSYALQGSCRGPTFLRSFSWCKVALVAQVLQQAANECDVVGFMDTDVLIRDSKHFRPLLEQREIRQWLGDKRSAVFVAREPSGINYEKKSKVRDNNITNTESTTGFMLFKAGKTAETTLSLLRKWWCSVNSRCEPSQGDHVGCYRVDWAHEQRMFDTVFLGQRQSWDRCIMVARRSDEYNTPRGKYARHYWYKGSEETHAEVQKIFVTRATKGGGRFRCLATPISFRQPEKGAELRRIVRDRKFSGESNEHMLPASNARRRLLQRVKHHAQGERTRQLRQPTEMASVMIAGSGESEFSESAPYKPGLIVAETEVEFPAHLTANFKHEGIWGRGACALQQRIGTVLRSKELQLATPRATLENNGTLLAASGTVELPELFGRAEMLAWVTCRRGTDTQPFFSVEIRGAARIGASIVLVAQSNSWSTFQVSWYQSQSSGFGTFELNVQFWASSQVFSEQRACANRGGSKPSLGNHVQNSPLMFETSKGSTKRDTPFPECKNRVPPTGAWVRLSPEKHGTEDTDPNMNPRGMFDPRDIIISRPCDDEIVSMSCRGRGSLGTPVKEVPFEYHWQPHGCRLKDFDPGAFIRGLSRQLSRNASDPETSDITMHFLGDSTTFYLCKTFATAVANSKLLLHSAKYTDKSARLHSEFGPFQVSGSPKLFVHCDRDDAGYSPLGQSEYLKSKLGQIHSEATSHQKIRSRQVFVVGSSNAHLLCHGKAQKRVHDGTVELIESARALNKAVRTMVVWMGPVYIGRSYAVQAETVFRDQRALWKMARDAATIVEQWHITKPLVHDHSLDGLHYHALLPRKAVEGTSRHTHGLSAPTLKPSSFEASSGGKISSTTAGPSKCACPPASSNSTSDDWFRFAGPAVLYSLKAMVNALLSKRPVATALTHKQEVLKRHSAWHNGAGT